MIDFSNSRTATARETSLPRLLTRWSFVGLVACIALFIVAYVYYFPKTYGIDDEVGFINQTVVWSKGAISAEGAGFNQLPDLLPFKGRHVPWRNPGRSIIALPFYMAGGVGAIFVSSLLTHLALTLVLARILKRIGVSLLWAALVLFHPTLALYSRTIMADEAAGLFFSLAILAAVSGVRRRGLWAGTAIGAAALMRYQSAIVLPIFAFALWRKEGRREAFECLAAGACFGALIAAYNVWLYGNLMGVTKQAYFSFVFVPRNLCFYFVALTLIYPLMFFAPLFDRSPARPFVLAICAPMLALLAPYYYIDTGATFKETLVLGQRLMQPALPAWIISYATVCERRALPWLRARLSSWQPSLVSPKFQAAYVVIICAALMLGCCLMFRRHQEHLNDLIAVREAVSSNVPAGSLVVGSATVMKLFAVPDARLPEYRWLRYDSVGYPIDNTAELQKEKSVWYLAVLPKTPGSELPQTLAKYVNAYHMVRVPTSRPELILYKARP